MSVIFLARGHAAYLLKLRDHLMKRFGLKTLDLQTGVAEALNRRAFADMVGALGAPSEGENEHVLWADDIVTSQPMFVSVVRNSIVDFEAGFEMIPHHPPAEPTANVIIVAAKMLEACFEQKFFASWGALRDSLDVTYGPGHVRHVVQKVGPGKKNVAGKFFCPDDQIWFYKTVAVVVDGRAL